MLPKFTKQQLALRNGQDKPEIWVAYKGKIFDVSDSRLWKNGKHYEHWAGQDLTDELKDAPHSETVFLKFTAVGELIDLWQNFDIKKAALGGFKILIVKLIKSLQLLCKAS